MSFDPCHHQVTSVIIRAGEVIGKIKGLPVESNVTVLYNETASLLGITPRQASSSESNHLPTPAEMKGEDGKFIIPRKKCPECKNETSLTLVSLCPSCKDSDGGKYHSAWKCIDPACGVLLDKSTKFLTQQLRELGVEIPEGPKRAFGIKTITDNGIK